MAGTLNEQAKGGDIARGALIVTATLGKADFSALDAMRRAYYPRERNRVPAHLTLFRSLPPSSEGEVRRSLSLAASGPRPAAHIVGLMELDQGVALRISSESLERLRDDLARNFQGLLTSQDLGRWTPHVTIQNKAEPRAARTLLRQLGASFEPAPLEIIGLELVRYAGGPWEPLATYRFRGA